MTERFAAIYASLVIACENNLKRLDAVLERAQARDGNGCIVHGERKVKGQMGWEYPDKFSAPSPSQKKMFHVLTTLLTSRGRSALSDFRRKLSPVSTLRAIFALTVSLIICSLTCARTVTTEFTSPTRESAPAGTFPVPAYQGFFDSAACDKIFGWAWDQNQPNTPINVDIFDGNSLLATITAGDFRSDLPGNKNHAFNYTTPSSLENGLAHTIHVKFGGTSTELTNSPRSLTCAPAPHINSISPNPVPGKSTDQTVSILGTGFVSGAGLKVHVTSSSVNTDLTGTQVTWISAAQINIQITVGTSADNWTATVINPDGQSSNGSPFSVTAAVAAPHINSISPNPVPGKSTDQTVSILGTGFVSGAGLKVHVTSSSVNTDLTGTQVTWISAAQINIQITVGTGADNWTATVINPDGQSSNGSPFSVTAAAAAPSISNIVTSPNPPLAGQFNFTITGLNYNTSNAEVFFLGPGCSTTTACVVTALTRSATTLTGPATLADGYFTVQVRNGSGGTPSGTWPLIVGAGAGTPTISNMTTSPNPPVTGQQFNFTITGLNYNTSNAEVFFLGPGCSTTTACVVTPTRTATTLTGSATLAAGSFTAQVRNGSGGTPSGTWPLTVNTTTASSPLQVIGIEVTQGVQDLANSVLLIEGRRTYVRVHVQSTAGDIAGVKGQLIVTRITNGQRTELGRREAEITVPRGPVRTSPTDSFLFQLDKDWCLGKLEILFQGINWNFERKTDATFYYTPPLQVNLVTIVWNDSIGPVRPSGAQVREVEENIRKLLPVADLVITKSELPWPRQPVGEAAFTEVNKALLRKRVSEGCVRASGCLRYYLGLVAQGPTGAPLGKVSGQAYWVDGYHCDPNMHGDVAIAYVANELGNRAAFPPVHELAHDLGRYHTDYEFADQKDIGSCPHDPDDGTIGGLGKYQYAPDTVYGFDGTNVYRSGTPDLMSYGQFPWISKFTYTHIWDRISSSPGSAKFADSTAVSADVVNVGDPAVIVAGSVSLLTGLGEISSVDMFAASSSSAPGPEPGEYLIRLENSQGNELASYSFSPDVPSSGSTGIFALLLPWSTSTARIVLLHNGQVINSRSASSHAPTVIVTYPNGGEALIGSTATIRWSANDPDSDPLSYVVQYSSDGGATWKTLAIDWPSTTYDLDLTAIVGTTHGLVRVLASDGFYTAQDQSDATFTVNRHLPQARIQSPQNSTLYVSDQTIILEGDGFDADDGQLGDAAMSWSSNLDGALGSGRALSVNASALKEGTHTISLTARDSDGQTGSASVTIQVSRARPTLAASLSVSPTATSFAIGTGSTQTAPDIIAVRNNGDGNLNWSASADQTWIRLSSTTGPAPANISVSADPTGLSAGQYAGHVTVTTSDAPNSPQTVNISLNVVSTTVVQLSALSYTVNEGQPSVNISLTRTGDTTSSASVGLATSDSAGLQNCNIVNGIASSRCDYIGTLSTVNFGPGETSKTISILIVDDAYAEGNESFTINLSNASGATLGTQAVATITITDNDSATGVNPIDQAPFFVDEHYADFLNRLADPSGRAFWINEITSCGSSQACIDLKRINVSAAYFLSVEFQQTGYLVERTYKAAYGSASGASTFGGAHSLSVPVVRLNEFLPDTQEIGQGVIVGQTGWETVLENNKQAFMAEFVQRSRFTTANPSSMTPAAFIDKLFANAGVTPLAADRTAAINEFGSATTTSDAAARARALRRVAENPTLVSQESNRAFVLMQYFGYLRRNPNDPQDSDYTGYDFWLTKLNQFNGNFQSAEMVKAFIVSGEYRQRFGP